MNDEQTLQELKKLNKKLEIIDHPLKNVGYNFIAGVSHSLGSLFGTVVVAAAIVYILSRINFTTNLTNYIQKTLPSTQIYNISPSPGP